VDQAGKITSITGTGIVGSGGEDLPAFGLPAGGISGVAADLMHNIYVGECRNVVGRIRMIDQQGYIRTIAGGWTNVDARDQAGPLKARLGCPSEMKVAADGTVYFIDGFRSVRRLVPEVTRFPRVAQGGALHGATFLPGPVSPGMLLTVFGSNLGRASIDRTGISSGRLGTVAGATAVLFDGVPAPMVYSTEGQLAVMAPYSLRAGGKTRIAVNIDHAQSTPIELDVAAARPGIFTADSSGRGQAAMLNQDGSVNSAGNPAAPGSIVVLFGTGEGQTAPPVLDGTINNGPAFPKPVLPVGVLMCGEPAEILYGGAAPASPAGILQVNARIPESCRNTRNAEIRLRVGDFLSPAGVTVAIKTD
jgi:uncharacterized protein (TIGR03437 family)